MYVCVCVCIPGVSEVVKALPDLQHVFAGEQSFLRSSTHGLQLHLGVQQTTTHTHNQRAATEKDTLMCCGKCVSLT